MKNMVVLNILLLIFATGTMLHAASPAPQVLPPGSIYGVAGEALLTEEIGKNTATLLVLIRKGNPGGEKMLSFLAGLKKPLTKEKLLVLVGGVDEKLLKATSARHVKLSASWYRDTEDLVSKGLKLNATPAVLGIRDAKVAWTSFGVTDAELLESTMRGWLNR